MCSHLGLGGPHSHTLSSIHTDRETGRAHSALGSFVRCSAGYRPSSYGRSYRMHINVCVVERKAKPRAPAEAGNSEGGAAV